MSEQPAFEIRCPEHELHIKIFACGRVEGLDRFGSTMVVNHIPRLIAEANHKEGS